MTVLDDRAGLKPDICVPCNQRGHICKAIGENEAGERCCIFCLDGEPCPYEAAQRRSRAAQPGHFLPEKAKVAEEKKCQRQEREKEKGKTMETKLCACGCGTPLTEKEAANSRLYHHGHKPKDGSAVRKATKGKKAASRKTQGTKPLDVVTLRVPPAALDQWWGQLNINDKARIFEAHFEA